MEGKVRKFGLKLTVEKTKVATKIWRRTFLENCKNQLFKLHFFKNQESKVCSNKWTYFTSKWAGLK